MAYISQGGAAVTLNQEDGLSVTVGPVSLGIGSTQFDNILNGVPSSLAGSQSASNGSLLSNISIDGNPLTAIQGALSSLAGAGAAPTTTQANQSIGSVSLVEDATKTLFVSFKNGL